MTPEGDAEIQKLLARLANSSNLRQMPTGAELRAGVDGRRAVRRRGLVTASCLAGVTLLILALTIPFAVRPAHNTPSATSSHVSRPGLVSVQAHVDQRYVAPGSKGFVPVGVSEQEFSLAFLDQLAAESHDANVVASPAGLDELLTMLEAGAAGDTQSQIAAVTRSEAAPLGETMDDWDSFLTQLSKDAGGSIHQRTTVVLQDGAAIAQAWLDSLKADFGTGVHETDFGSPAVAAAEIQTWLDQYVTNRPTQLFPAGSLFPGAGLVLASSLEFQDSWSNKVGFGRVLPTESEPFALADGQSVQVPMMRTDTSLVGSITAGYDAVVLPYANDSMQAIAIEPSAGSSLQTLLRSLTPGLLNSLTSARLDKVALSLPRFSIGSQGSVTPALEAMGMRAAFTATGDLAGIKRGAEVQSAVEANSLSVDERGTDLTSGEAGSFAESAKRAYFNVIDFDRPFIWLLRDRVTGAILSEAIIANPGASQ